MLRYVREMRDTIGVVLDCTRGSGSTWLLMSREQVWESTNGKSRGQEESCLPVGHRDMMEISSRVYYGQCRLTWIHLQRLLELKYHMWSLPDTKKSRLASDRPKVPVQCWDAVLGERHTPLARKPQGRRL